MWDLWRGARETCVPVKRMEGEGSLALPVTIGPSGSIDEFMMSLSLSSLELFEIVSLGVSKSKSPRFWLNYLTRLGLKDSAAIS